MSLSVGRNILRTYNKKVHMNKLAVALTVALISSSASAQSRRSLKDTGRELKPNKGTSTAMAPIAPGDSDKTLLKILSELDNPGISKERKVALLNQIKGSKSPEQKKILKELALKHKDEDIRKRSRLALINAMLANPEDGDSDFLYNWLSSSIDDPNAAGALTAVRKYFPDKHKPIESRFIPVITGILGKGKYGRTRSKAAGLLGACKITTTLPYLQECVLKDADAVVRGACGNAYYTISGESPKKPAAAEGRQRRNASSIPIARRREGSARNVGSSANFKKTTGD